MQNIPLINYKELRKISLKTARQSVIEYLKSTGHNISATAKAFGINRSVVYDILINSNKVTYKTGLKYHTTNLEKHRQKLKQK